MTAFASASAVLFADPHLSTAAVWTPEGGDPVALRLMLRRPDQVQEWGEARIVTGTVRADIRTADAPTLAHGDAIAVGATAYIVNGEPTRDPLQLVWSATLVPA